MPATLVFATLTLPALLLAEPSLAAVAAQAPQLPARCRSLRCGDEEWRARLPYAPPSAPAPKPAASRLPGGRRAVALHAPASRRDSVASYSNRWRVGTRYGVQALRDGNTKLGLSVGAAYRISPLHDDGVGVAGPVLRGELDLRQRLGERATWPQRVQWETAPGGEVFVKQSIALDVSLWENWMLETDYVVRHHHDGPSGPETAEGWLGLRRRF